jgi:endonuclease/exonuclease/phosphatase (EEP) superfamily protein YafD
MRVSPDCERPASRGAQSLSSRSRPWSVALVLLAMMGSASSARVQDDAVWLARHPDTALRVLVWNVDRTFFRENAGFQRVLDTIDADLLILDEMPAGVSGEEIASALPAREAPWHVLYGTGGGPHQRASIAVQRPLQRVPEFDQLPYPREHFEEWVKVVPPAKQQRALGSLEAGVATVAGVVEHNGRRLLVVGLDLECCGDSADSAQEQRRQFESRAIRAAIDAVAEPLKVDAVLVGGDFNPVNGSAPLDIMYRGASARTSLAAVETRHRGKDGAAWTWNGRETPYPSGRLDYLMHSSALVVLQSQIFDSDDLDTDLLRALGIAPGLSHTLSPHRPIVVDFAWDGDISRD